MVKKQETTTNTDEQPTEFQQLIWDACFTLAYLNQEVVNQREAVFADIPFDQLIERKPSNVLLKS